jgi:cysteine sulfinate desulfinase/cysteine desulfurase-like protein
LKEEINAQPIDTDTPEDTAKLAGMETALGEATKSLEAKTGECEQLKAALDDAVRAYRKLAVGASPLYSDDIISGSSIDEIDSSIKKVNGLVKKMRSSLEAELKELTIPAGAPERSAPDTSGLSPREKIKQGLDRK